MTLPDVDTLDSLGGAKENYGPVEDPTTDRDATLANKAYADVAMMTRTASRAWVRFMGDATTPTIVSHDAVWSKDPTYVPTVERLLTGVWVVTWPDTVNDEIDTVDHGRASHTVNLRAVRPPHVEGSFPFLATAAVLTANSVKIYTHTVALGADDVVGRVVFVEVL